MDQIMASASHSISRINYCHCLLFVAVVSKSFSLEISISTSRLDDVLKYKTLKKNANNVKRRYK